MPPRPPLTLFHKRQVQIAGARVPWTRLTLSGLGAFLGFAVPFAVALTLKRQLARRTYLVLRTPLLVAGAGFCALIPLSFLWLLQQMWP